MGSNPDLNLPESNDEDNIPIFIGILIVYFFFCVTECQLKIRLKDVFISLHLIGMDPISAVSGVFF